MKTWVPMTENNSKENKAEIKLLIDQCTPGMVDYIKKVFWATVDKMGMPHEEYRMVEPQWCAAIDGLPSTDFKLNSLMLEITVDVVKRGMNEYIDKWRGIVSPGKDWSKIDKKIKKSKEDIPKIEKRLAKLKNYVN